LRRSISSNVLLHYMKSEEKDLPKYNTYIL
jgi:hypothetical protein